MRPLNHIDAISPDVEWPHPTVGTAPDDELPGSSP